MPCHEAHIFGDDKAKNFKNSKSSLRGSETSEAIHELNHLYTSSLQTFIEYETIHHFSHCEALQKAEAIHKF